MFALLLACIGTGTDDKPQTEDTGDTGDSQVEGPPRVSMETSMGTLVIELDPDNAPITVANFLTYVDEGFYDGDDGLGATTFHRVISGFMCQGGGYTADGTAKTTNGEIENESTTDSRNVRGSVAMARRADADTATSQFFVNEVDNAFLDYDGSYPPGYAVFGQVVDGMEVIDAMADVATNSNDAPLETVLILEAERL